MRPAFFPGCSGYGLSIFSNMNVRGEEQRGFDVNRTLKLARVPGSEMHHHLHLREQQHPKKPAFKLHMYTLHRKFM